MFVTVAVKVEAIILGVSRFFISWTVTALQEGNTQKMKYAILLVIVSGRSGSGKSTALHALEDEGFYCIDNLPFSLLPDLVNTYTKKIQNTTQDTMRLAVGIDVRNTVEDLRSFSEDFLRLRQKKYVKSSIVFLDANHTTLLKRFGMTRRLHPMSQSGISLEDAINEEYARLETISTLADIRLDTSQLSVHDLRCIIRKRIAGYRSDTINILCQSFGFKYGVPTDADFVFDVRCLPNPYWIAALRELTGKDQPVIDYLNNHQSVLDMQNDIFLLLMKWISHFQDNARSYLTIALGCTGGKHRSVFLCEALYLMLKKQGLHVSIRHREH